MSAPRRPCRWWGVALAALLLSGCARPDLDGLDAELKAMRERPQGHVDALPEQPRYRPVAYSHADRRGPFTPWAALAPGPAAGPRPDTARAKDPLEAYPLDALRFAGTLFADGRAVALIQTPDGGVQRLYIGQHMGEHAGRVEAIERNRLVIVELMADGADGWRRQARELRLDQAATP